MQQDGSLSHGPQLGDVTPFPPRMAEFADLVDARLAEPGVATQGGASICLPFTRKWEAERWWASKDSEAILPSTFPVKDCHRRHQSGAGMGVPGWGCRDGAFLTFSRQDGKNSETRDCPIYILLCPHQDSSIPKVPQ